MINIIFIVVLMVYIYVWTTIEKWTTIYRLWFKLSTPEFFIQYPKIYMYISYINFIILLIVGFFTKIPYISLSLTILMFFLTWIKGRKMAIKLYREILNSLLEQSNTNEDKETLKNTLNKSDNNILRSI